MEVLVGLVILAVLLAAVRLAFPDRAERHAELAAERTLALIALACERAQLTGRTMGIGLAAERIAFGPMADGRWAPLPAGAAEALRERPFEPGLQLELKRDGTPMPLPATLPQSPQLACQGNGDLDEFSLEIRAATGMGWRLRGDADGGLSLAKTDAKG